MISRQRDLAATISAPPQRARPGRAARRPTSRDRARAGLGLAGALAGLATAALISCNAILGFDRGDPALPATGGAGGGAGAGATSSAAGHGGAGGLGGAGASGGAAPRWRVVWADRYGGPETDCGFTVAAASDGVVFAGHFRDSASFGGETLVAAGGGVEPEVDDMFVAKRLGDGSLGFVHGYGTTRIGELFHEALVADNGHITLVGNFRDPIDFGGGEVGPLDVDAQKPLVLRLDSAGQHVASHGYGIVGGAAGNGLALHPNGSYHITGWFGNAISFGGDDLTTAGDWDIYVAAFDSLDNHLWSRSWGGPEKDLGRALVSVDDGVVLVGQFDGQFDFEGYPVMAGAGTHAFVVKLDEVGAVSWAHSYGDEALDVVSSATAVATDPDGNILVVGQATGDVSFGEEETFGGNTADLFVLKLSPNGDHEWVERYSSGTNQEGWAVATRPSGNVVVAGLAFGTHVDFGGEELPSLGGNDAFVVELRGEDGVHVASMRFGGTGSDRAKAAAIDDAGHVWLTGCFTETMLAGTEHELQSAGSGDVYLIELSL